MKFSEMHGPRAHILQHSVRIGMSSIILTTIIVPCHHMTMTTMTMLMRTISIPVPFGISIAPAVESL